jgi:hypothetical protein
MAKVQCHDRGFFFMIGFLFFLKDLLLFLEKKKQNSPKNCFFFPKIKHFSKDLLLFFGEFFFFSNRKICLLCFSFFSKDLLLPKTYQDYRLDFASKIFQKIIFFFQFGIRYMYVIPKNNSISKWF